MATVTSKGQVTIPKKVRDALGLKPGSHVDFDLKDGKVTLRRYIPDEVFERWRGAGLAAELERGGTGRTDDLMLELRGDDHLRDFAGE